MTALFSKSAYKYIGLYVSIRQIKMSKSSLDVEVEKLLEKIKTTLNLYIDKMQINSTTKSVVKMLVSSQVNQIPKAISSGKAKKFVATLMKNRYVAKNEGLQKQIGAAYFALQVALEETPAKRQVIVNSLLDASCFQTAPQRKEAIRKMLQKECQDYTCSPQKYWEIFTEVDAACWYAMYSSK